MRQTIWKVEMPPFAVGGGRGAPGWLQIVVSSPKHPEKEATIGQPETLSFLFMMASVPATMFVFPLSAEYVGISSPQE
jgi:hypothetical protein